ncbi:haloalkane dehalogenase [Flammeovirga agarivorans]|uniref:Haloalkane dehalogenase n=1 Tax=Flammeovirga agarivorans TaxID=2726742 RepID=A0A7X8SNJ3_9BACT|nr:haloalkane dehalogenase [Flammeovirga agarivorans]NLR93491.1 haloalkane dehalogenase [Flammeovirga agarivorans]
MQSKNISVHGSNMHVLTANEESSKSPILFLHGNPSNAFIWRNIAPIVASTDHPIYVSDLIGMGKSDKPAIDYTFAEQYMYVEKLIDTLNLRDVILVLHDWGSGLGFHYFAMHESNVKAIAFMEGIIQDIGTFFDSATIDFFHQLRGENGWKMICEDNIFLQNVLPTWVSRGLTEEEVEGYTSPFKIVESRKPIWKWVSQVPLNGKPELMASVVENYRTKLSKSTIPKLFCYAEPGAFMPEPVKNWIIENIPNLKSVNVGDGIHFIQEDHPEEIGKAIKEFVITL